MCVLVIASVFDSPKAQWAMKLQTPRFYEAKKKGPGVGVYEPKYPKKVGEPSKAAFSARSSRFLTSKPNSARAYYKIPTTFDKQEHYNPSASFVSTTPRLTETRKLPYSHESFDTTSACVVKDSNHSTATYASTRNRFHSSKTTGNCSLI